MDSGFLSSDACAAAIAGRPLPLTGPGYVHRQPGNSAFATLEAECAAAIAAAGALIRIKGAWQTGKTSLIHRLVAHAQQLNYATAVVDIQALVGPTSELDLDRFLYDFCTQVTQRLQLPDQLDDYWDDLFGSAIGCKSYFEEYLLPTLERPLLLTLDDIDRLFPYPQLADEFFGLLRAWHEEAKTRDLWRRLRLVVAHSAEVYIPLNLNKSPFNVGIPVDLSAFNASQVVQLAKTYDVELTIADGEQLIDLLGGWPHLVQIALHHLAVYSQSVTDLAAVLVSQPGPFAADLRHLAETIAANPPLAADLYKVMNSDCPVDLPVAQALKLQSLGVVRLQGQSAGCSCELYRTYLTSSINLI